MSVYMELKFQIDMELKESERLWLPVTVEQWRMYEFSEKLPQRPPLFLTELYTILFWSMFNILLEIIYAANI